MSKPIHILIPVPKPPYVEDQRINSIKSIISKLENFVSVNAIWLVYPPSESILEETNDEKNLIVNYDDYENAVDILDKFHPDFVFVNGMIEFVNLSFILAAKYEKIPLLTTFFLPTYIYKQQNVLSGIKQQLRYVIRNRYPDVHLKSNSQPKAMPYFKQKYVFFKKTIKKINKNKIYLLKFFGLIFRLRLYGGFKVHQILEGDLNLCSTLEWRPYLENIGFKKNSIKIVGNPFYDTLYLKIQSNNTSEVKKKSILFCPSAMHEHGLWTKEQEFDLIRNVLDVLTKNQFHVALKIHPSSSDYHDFHEFLTNSNFNIELFQKENLFELLTNYEILLTYGPGSVTLYGILMEKPVVFLNFFNERDHGHADQSVTIHCNRLSDLISKINESKSKTNADMFNQYIEKNLYKFDGKCSERATVEIMNFYNTKTS